MQKWEYETAFIGLDWDGDINVRKSHMVLSEMGEDGWELATIVDGIAIFKRHKLPNLEKIEREVDIMQKACRTFP